MGVNLVVLDIQSRSIRINIRSYPLSVQGKTTNQSHPANVNENLMLDMYCCLTAFKLQIVTMHSFIYYAGGVSTRKMSSIKLIDICIAVSSHIA